MRRVRARLLVRRCRRRTGHLRPPVRRFRGSGRRVGGRVPVSAAVLAARALVGSVDPAGHARAAAPVQGHPHHPAIPSRRGGRALRQRRQGVTAAARPDRRGLLVPSLAAIDALAVLIGLGPWQVERKTWKEGLIATIDARLSAPPTGLPLRETWDERGALEFRHVAFAGSFLEDQETLVYTAGSSLRGDVSGPGYWVFTPARLADGGLVVVDRGF